MVRLQSKKIVIREVWSANLHSEFKLIESIIDRYPFISMDTEFPGVVVMEIDGESYEKNPTPEKLYRLLRENVSVLKLIQVGVTFTDSDGNLPNLGSNIYNYIWQFNFSDFDVVSDLKSPESIKLLRKQGIDFTKNRAMGIDSIKFAELMSASGMVCNENVQWIAFHGSYDFAYLIKILTQRELPEELSDFMVLTKIFFGEEFYDVKCLMKHCDGLYGGLDRVANMLWLRREVGRCHQAGSDSLLTWRVFRQIWSFFFTHGGMEKYAGVLHRNKRTHEISESGLLNLATASQSNTWASQIIAVCTGLNMFHLLHEKSACFL